MPKDARWSKNRLAVLRKSTLIDMAENFNLVSLVREIIDKVPTEQMWDYLKARAEAEAPPDEEGDEEP